MPTKQPRSAPHRTTQRTGVDSITGEVRDFVTTDPVPAATLKKLQPDYVITTEDFRRLEATATQKDIVLLILERYPLKGPRLAPLTQIQIAEELDLARSSAQDAMRDLQARKVIYAEGRSKWYVNPHLGWKGRTEDWHAFRFGHELARLRRNTPQLRALD